MDRRQLEVLRAATKILEAGGHAAMATVLSTRGSAPQTAGARMLLDASGRQLGTVGGGRIEAAVLEALAQCLVDGESRKLCRDLTRELGMCCGGSMELWIEPVDGGPRLWVFGAGHVGRATAPLAAQAGFRVLVIDEREELLSEVDVPHGQRLAVSAREALRNAGPAREDYMLIATHDPRLDEEALYESIRLPHRYVGLVASRRKALTLVRRVRERHGPQCLDRLFAPVGLDLGGDSPFEIAIAIVAELLAVRHGHDAAQLRLTLE